MYNKNQFNCSFPPYLNLNRMRFAILCNRERTPSVEIVIRWRTPFSFYQTLDI